MKSNSIRFLNVLWVFTVLYYCFGRVQWKIPSYPALLIYVTICYASINIGYRHNKWQAYMKRMDGQRRYKAMPETTAKDISFDDVKALFVFSCVFVIVFQILWVYTYFGMFRLSNMLSIIGSNYFSRLETELSGNSATMQIKTFFWIFAYFVYPIGFYFFREMHLPYKILFIFSMIIDIMASLNMGISKNLGDVIIIFIAVILINPTTSNTGESIRKTLKKNRKRILIVGLITLTFLIMFGVIQTQRSIAVGHTGINIKVNARFGNIRQVTLIDLLFAGNRSLSNVFDQLGVYLSHGYTGLAYALNLNFENTWGLGFSRALMDYARQYLGIDVSSLTYCARLEETYGWPNGVSWPTAFVWIGNAVSLWLVPFVLLWLGRLWCKAEYIWRYEHRLMGLIVYSQFFIAFVYMSCNAQIVQSRQAFIATIMMLILFNGHIFKRGTKDIIPSWL